jgi:soluble lytic murein transglycosylase-like protein
MVREFFDRGTRRIAGVALGLLVAALGAAGARADEPQKAGDRYLFAELTGPLVPLDRVGRLPGVLNAADRERYRRIFALQEAGDWASADLLIAQLADPVLLGHVLFQRYMHPTRYRSSYAELEAWLDQYADLPGAARVHRLAVRRRPAGAAAPRRPEAGYLSGNGEIGEHVGATLPRRKLSPEQRRQADALSRKVESLIARGRPTAAREVLSRYELVDWLSEAEYDALRATVARGYFAFGGDAEALAIAARAARRSGALVGESHWIAGLAAWRLGDPETAAGHFATLAEAEGGDPYLVAGGAYWAARAYGVLRKPLSATRMLRLAADHPRTIYGLLALRSLFERPAFAWEPPRLSRAMVRLLLRSPGVRRAIALAEIGQTALAEDEVRTLYPRVGRGMGAALLSLAEWLSLAGVQIRLGSLLAAQDGRRHDRALYPVPAWRPAGGFDLDRALLFALVRQESTFDSRAKSPAGARGLMQLMPRTASFVDGGRTYHKGGADALFAPELNLALGQKYVRYLLALDEVEGNLVFMLAAYNAGPRRLRDWIAKIDTRDPLLFIESIPMRETRRFARRVLTNLWIYRDRLEQPVTSLEQLAAGRWPTYRDFDAERVARLALGH